MENARRISLFLAAIFFLHSTSSSQLSVKADFVYGSRPGYIDDATLVVEPHGAYVEQSLYLTYSDHSQYSYTSNLELVHRFQLPAGAVVNDLWLWIGDSVMKARMFDTWTARHIYDSIVTTKKDPAYLTKLGNFYELRIYPLLSGKFRKVKLNFILPTRWFGVEGTAELPLKMLKDNNAPKKPLQLLFRQRDSSWGLPKLVELPQTSFAASMDTNRFLYRKATLSDISILASLTLGYNTSFAGGYFFSTNDVNSDATYFQIGFTPGPLFKLPIDSTAQHVLFGLDLSGGHNKKFTTLIPNLKQFIRSVSKPNDSIAVVVAGGGSIRSVGPSWKIAHSDTIIGILDRFAASDFGKSVGLLTVPHILYADNHAATCWQFPGLTDLATYQNHTNLLSAIQNFSQAEVIAAYDHGFEQASQTQSNVTTIIAKIDSFFAQGGRFLSYYDYNRRGKEVIGSHYIKGLSSTYGVRLSGSLYRNQSGNIGINFPVSFVPHFFDYLVYDPDPEVKIEVQDEAGKPVVISKRVGNGLLVISGIWSFSDDAAMRALLGTPLLGLNTSRQPQQLKELLAEIRNRSVQTSFSRAFVISNGDSLVQKEDALTWAASYIDGFSNPRPFFNTVNLLDGTGFIPAYLTDGQIDYYGSGYLLKSVSGTGEGSHFETHVDSWSFISGVLGAYSYPTADSVTVAVTVDNGSGRLNEIREVNPMPQDPMKARFFIGSTSIANEIQFNLRARFSGTSAAKDSSFSFFVDHDTSAMDRIIPSMLGYEKLKDKFNAGGKDTAGIVKLAMQYNLLTDYTALLALEPNETNHFMKDPFDESRLLDVERLVGESLADSLTLQSYPNPFNSRTTIAVNVSRQSVLNLCIYNILGQLVKVLASNDMLAGRKVYFWDGRDANNRTVNSGVYFIRMIARQSNGGRETSRLSKISFIK